jgi:putative oxidoreductase
MTRHFPTAARVLLGSIFFVFGLNGFLGFLPQPPVTPEGGAFLGALVATGYFFPLLKATEVAVGLALLSGRLVPLALTVLAPVSIHITAFHLFLSPGLALPAAVLALQLYLAYAYRESFRGVLRVSARPATAPAAKAAPLHPAHA